MRYGKITFSSQCDQEGIREVSALIRKVNYGEMLPMLKIGKVYFQSVIQNF